MSASGVCDMCNWAMESYPRTLPETGLKHSETAAHTPKSTGTLGMTVEAEIRSDFPADLKLI